MELWQILAIALGSVFTVMFLVWIVFTVLKKRHNDKLMAVIEETYSDPSRLTMDYDFTVSEEDEMLIARGTKNGGQASAFNSAQQLAVLGASDTENLEEITGNYKP